MATATPQDESVLARAMADIDATAPGHDDPEEQEVPETTEPESHDSELDDLEIQVAHREWRVQGAVEIVKRNNSLEQRDFDKTYVQKPLSFTAMLQFTGLIGERLAGAMAGPEGLTVDGVLGEGDGIGSVFSRQDFSSLDSFVKGLAKLAEYAPSVIEDCQCIWLRVPWSERPIVKEIWSRSPEDGGLSIPEGREMLETFLSQNYREVEDFFVEQLPRLAKRLAKLRGLGATDSRRSKRSSPTPAPTQSE